MELRKGNSNFAHATQWREIFFEGDIFDPQTIALTVKWRVLTHV